VIYYVGVFLLKEPPVIDGSLPDSGHRMSANFNVANNRTRPILLKNSVFQADEKFSALQAH
jgi:hypothetical protein